ncbi:signal transduction histidine kinase [Paenibacillus castaneae]|uniref:sensor histidine kinase n=1 Tax=Paenibacillus castaneae TaxID=474957 RepID=UPI000C9BAE29|nr:HAMP domain-containing sensor histidine kinase [Paenibacillus castaneae]NIK79132.1 signal transduction histidine kinase [Paenibacillus castaneae]
MKKSFSKIGIVLRFSMSITLLFAYSGLTFSLAYWLLNWFYDNYEVDGSPYIRQLINWGLGIVFMFLSIALFGLIARPRQRAIWLEVIAAIRRMAKGDFNVTIKMDKYQGQVGQFIESINDMASELKQVERLRQEFISNVSHEIQSPLTSIRGFASTLQREGLSLEEQRHYLSIIEKETTRLSKISDNLLKLTTLESEQQELDAHSYRLDQQLESIVLACEPQWLEKELELELELPETEITANEGMLSQVWVNLIHNAIKFTPDHGNVKVMLSQTEHHVKVRIEDSGIGISSEDQQRIFERFYKGDKQRTRTAEGSGLGLSIVKKIIELHKGEIVVESRLGEGSTFEVFLPK